MSLSRIGAIALRILKQFGHDPRTIALVVIVPLLVMALIGYLIGDSGKGALPVAVVNLDAGADASVGHVELGEQIVSGLSAQGSIEVRTVPSEATATERVRAGDAAGALIVPADLTRRVLAGEEASIRVVVGGIDPNLQGPVITSAARAVQTLTERGSEIGFRASPLSVQTVPLEGGASLSPLDYDAPILLTFFAFFLTFLLTSVSFLRERSSGTLERLMASPASRLDVLLGYLLGFIGFAGAQALLILGYATWVLDVRIAGSIWLVLLVLVILLIGVVNLGISLSFFARNELQVVQFIPLVLIPQVFLGGLVWPVQTLWTPLRWLSQLFPLTHSTVALRGVMVGGEGFGDIAWRLLALLAFSVAMVAVGVMALRKQRA
ncbi:MAG: ABC transporter permease [Actinomycetota bacterium]